MVAFQRLLRTKLDVISQSPRANRSWKLEGHPIHDQTAKPNHHYFFIHPFDSPSALAITTSPFTILGTCSLCEVQHAPAWANDHPTNHSVITKYSFYRRAKGYWAIHWRKIPMNLDKQPFQGHPCFWMLCVSAKTAKPVCGCSCDKPLWLTCFSNVACKVSQAPRAYC